MATGTDATPPPPGEDPVAHHAPHHTGWREIVVVVLLSVTTILTAWVGFQASQWGGEESAAFSEATAARIEAARHEGVANRKLAVQATLFSQWVGAHDSGQTDYALFLADRFPEPLATAFPVWLASQPFTDPDAASTPFDLPEYRIPELDEAQAADERAHAHHREALADDRNGDRYTFLTVAFASVLFFAAMSSRMRFPVGRDVLLGLAVVVFVVGAALLVAYPKDV